MHFTAEIARENIEGNLIVRKRNYDRNLYQTLYEVGDLVYLRDESVKKGISKKLRPVFKGPFLVVKVHSDMLYTIQDRKRQSVIHHNRLKHCEDRYIPLWLRKLRSEILNLNETFDAEEDVSFSLDPDQNISTLFDDACAENVSITDKTSGEQSKELLVPTAPDVSSDLLFPFEPPVEVVTSTPSITTRTGRRVKKPFRFRDYAMSD